MDDGERKGGRRQEETEEDLIEWLCSLSRAVTNRARAPSALEEVAVTLANIARRYGEGGGQQHRKWKESSLPPELSGNPEACMWHAPDGAMWGTGAREVARVISAAKEKAAEEHHHLEIATLGCWRMWTLGVLFEGDEEGGGGGTPPAVPLVFVILPGSQRYIRSVLDRVAEQQGEKGTRAFLCRTCYDSASLLGRRGRAAATKAFLAMRFLDYERAAAASFFGGDPNVDETPIK